MSKSCVPPLGDDAGTLLIVGYELRGSFAISLGNYLDALEGDGYSRNTLNDRKSILWSVRQSAVELFKTYGLPESFSEALTHLVRGSGKSHAQLAAESGVADNTLRDWMRDRSLVSRSSLPAVERLEDVFGVPRGTLAGRLTHFTVVHHAGRIVRGATPWRDHQRELSGLRYKFRALPPEVNAEFNDLVGFHTGIHWVRSRRLKRNSEWRIDPDGNIPSADRNGLALRGFFGYLVLPTGSDDPRLAGRGMSADSLSLALLSDASLPLGYVEFMRQRSYSQSYNTGTATFLNFCASLLRDKTGFLRQQPQYGAKLPTPVSPECWGNWCEENRREILYFLKDTKESDNQPIVMTRDPFAAVREFIDEIQHPISIMIEMAENMKRLIPLLEKGDPVTKALHVRDTFLAEFATSYPLRVKNFSRMKAQPFPSGITAGGDGPPPPDEVNLYQKRDDSWWVRFRSREMKNGKAVDVPVARSIVGVLEDYMFVRRLVIIKAVKETINSRRAELGMALLTPEQESTIDRCPYVFRPGPRAIRRMGLREMEKFTGAEPIFARTLYERMLMITQRYIPGCKGFGLHAVRALVASEYIKNHPNGWAAAAAALNDTEATVRKHYAWVRSCDKIKPWQEYHEDMKRQFGGGGSSSPVVVV